MKIFDCARWNLHFLDLLYLIKLFKYDNRKTDYITSEFEKSLCQYTGAKYVLAVNNSINALSLALAALEFKTDDELITSALTDTSFVKVLENSHLHIVFADIDKETGNLNPAEIKNCISNKTKAIMPFHFAGQSCDMEKIKNIADEHNLFVIENATLAFASDYKNSKVGSCKYSDMTIFDFSENNTLNACGCAAITTNNEDLFKKLISLRSAGNNTYVISCGYKISTLQAAIGLSHLKRIKTLKKQRREIVQYYNNNLGLKHLPEKNFSKACFTLYPVFMQNKTELLAKFKNAGLNLSIDYKPLYSENNNKDYTVCDNFYNKAIYLPLYNGLTDKDLEIIVNRIKKNL